MQTALVVVYSLIAQRIPSISICILVSNPVPVIVTSVPPTVVPREGLIDVIVGVTVLEYVTA